MGIAYPHKNHQSRFRQPKSPLISRLPGFCLHFPGFLSHAFDVWMPFATFQDAVTGIDIKRLPPNHFKTPSNCPRRRPRINLVD